MSTVTKEANNNNAKSTDQKGNMNRNKKPTPLNLHQAPPLMPPPPQMLPMPIEDVIELMDIVVLMVRNNQFSAVLQGNILKLCAQLRLLGESLECTHPHDLNRCFIALRQACCRDNGALGTGCRLKIMELIEMRAQAWRANFSHSHYYMQRGAQINAQLALRVIPQYALLAANAPIIHKDAQGKDWDTLLAGSTHQHTLIAANAPTSAPPIGMAPVNPFGPPCQMSPMPMIGPDGSPSYYLVPATGGFMPPNYGLPPGSPGFAGPKTPSSIDAHAPLMDTPWPKGAVIKPSPRSLGPTKIDGKNQLRDEIVIRNADSGKIMGVKGRRVAVVEEISKTIISFAKVPPTSKDRTLTITGDSEEVIADAKLLIEQTIKRNVSPNRADGTFADSGEIREHTDDELEDDQLADVGIKFERGADGTLRLSSDNPAALEAAQEALSSYLMGRKISAPTTMHARKKSENKERSKSNMHISDSGNNKHEHSGSRSDRFADMDGNPLPLTHACYTRDELLKVNAQLPKDLPCPTIVEECEEILRK